jgi:hypothetical protein
VFNYENDAFGRACLLEAAKSKSTIGFGALLVKHGRIIGRGWNHRPRRSERGIISHVDYAIHAEQAAFVDAWWNGFRMNGLLGAEIYVLGVVLLGPERGKLTTRRRKEFICKKCPSSVFIPFRISVWIPHVSGWVFLSPEEALETSRRVCGNGYWDSFAGKSAAR